MPSPLDRSSAALLPLEGLAVLSGERCRGDVHVVIDGQRAWVAWPAGEESIWRPLLAVPGVAFFEQRDGRWHPLGQHLPRFDVPPRGEARRLDAVLFPMPVRAEPVPSALGTPARLRLVPGDHFHPTTAMRVGLAVLLPWAEQATTAELQACRGAIRGDMLLLRGQLPPLAAERFWGIKVLVPLGLRPDPDLPETALRAAAEVSVNEVLVLTPAGAEAIPEAAFEPLTRAGIRRAASRAAAEAHPA